MLWTGKHFMQSIECDETCVMGLVKITTYELPRKWHHRHSDIIVTLDHQLSTWWRHMPNFTTTRYHGKSTK